MGGLLGGWVFGGRFLGGGGAGTYFAESVVVEGHCGCGFYN